MEKEHRFIERDAYGNLVDAKVFLDRRQLDKGTMKQIKKMIVSPAIGHSRIMPDCHRGVGCCIGFTSHLQEKIVPNFIGGDIGCGIICWYVGKKWADTDFTTIEERIRESVVMGSGPTNVWKKPIVTRKDMEQVCMDAQYEATMFCEAYRKRFDVNLYKQMPIYDTKTWFPAVCRKIRCEEEYALRSLGTLGGGNHFIEVNHDDAEDLYLTVHTGSRGFGSKIKQYHQNKINEHKHFDRERYETEMKKIRRTTKHPKQLKKLTDQLVDDINSKRHPNYLEKEEAYEYFFDMIFAQKYAMLNRRLIIRQIFTRFPEIEFPNRFVESIHNYIDFTDLVIRKGAINAAKGVPCLVSLNMRDGILLCKGKGNPDWNSSSAHGSGRLIPRGMAIHRVSMTNFRRQMEGIVSSSVVLETLDEAPDVYKDSEMIKKALDESVEIVSQLRPVINLKALC